MKRFLLSVILIICGQAVKANAFSYVLGTANYPYSVQDQPAKNKSYIDATYHTTITRVSDKAIDNYKGARLITGYSTFSGVNSDGKYIVLMMCDASSKYALYNAVSNDFIKDLGLQSWNGDPEPRWDGSGDHPSWLYYVRGPKLMRMDVDSADPLGTSVVVHDFSAQYANCAYIKNDEEGDCSSDSRYWAFEIRDSAWKISKIVTYDMKADKILGSLASFPYDINCVSISPDGSKVLVDWQFVPHGQGKGPIAYNLDFTTTGLPWPVKNEATHWCWAQMRNGNLAVVSQNNETDQMQVFDVVTGKKFNILAHKRMGWNSGFHFFNTGKRGWAGMYTYSTPNSHAFWSYDQIYLMELKTNGRIFRVTCSQHKHSGEYFDEGHAQMDWHLTGTKLWFNANWRGTDNAEVYRIDLPKDWNEDIEAMPAPEETNVTDGSPDSAGNSSSWISKERVKTALSLAKKVLRRGYEWYKHHFKKDADR